MRLPTPLRPDPRAPLARANPVAKLAAAAMVMIALFFSIDVLTPALALVGILAAVPASGMSPGALLARAWPLLVAALALAVLNTLFAGDASGPVLLRIGPFSLREDAVASGLAVGLRVLGVALAGLLALASTDPTDLADSLQQQLHVPPRFAVGALAAVRLMPIMAREWQVLRLARRARGMSAGRSPLAAVRIAFAQLLALLVGAVRRGTRLATAMEARGFGTCHCRTAAREQRVGGGDWLLMAAGAALGVGAVGISLASGSWRFLFG